MRGDRLCIGRRGKNVRKKGVRKAMAAWKKAVLQAVIEKIRSSLLREPASDSTAI